MHLLQSGVEINHPQLEGRASISHHQLLHRDRSGNEGQSASTLRSRPVFHFEPRYARVAIYSQPTHVVGFALIMWSSTIMPRAPPIVSGCRINPEHNHRLYINKVYQAAVEEKSGGYVVNFAYGRRGSTMQTGTKKRQAPAGFDEAKKIYDRLIRENQTKRRRSSEFARRSPFQDAFQPAFGAFLLTALGRAGRGCNRSGSPANCPDSPDNR